MAKLGKREKIILGVVAIVILYAAFDYLAPKKKNHGEDMARKTTELNTFVTDLTAGLGKDISKNLGALIFSRAEKEWTQDPFLDGRAFKLRTEVKAPAEDTRAAAPKIEFVYAGYLEVGRKRMAIINGVEYREGEALDIKGFVLKTVSPTRVVIGTPIVSSGAWASNNAAGTIILSNVNGLFTSGEAIYIDGGDSAIVYANAGALISPAWTTSNVNSDFTGDAIALVTSGCSPSSTGCYAGSGSYTYYDDFGIQLDTKSRTGFLPPIQQYGGTKCITDLNPSASAYPAACRGVSEQKRNGLFLKGTKGGRGPGLGLRKTLQEVNVPDTQGVPTGDGGT